MDDRLCLLVIIGSDDRGNKALLALSDGYRESAASWEEVLMDLTQRGLQEPPKLAVGDGAFGKPLARFGQTLISNVVGSIKQPTYWKSCRKRYSLK